MSDDRIDEVRNRLARRLSRGRPGAAPVICVAWSGGIDSTVLLDLVDAVAARHPLEFAALHVHHGLREDADADAAFCRRMASRRGWTLEIEHLDVRSAPSTEAQARHQRYAALVGAARRLGATHLATAHHADDAIETALLNWCRGAGARGLGSLHARRRDSGPLPRGLDLELLRPLVNLPRRRIHSYARHRGIEWRTDPTNAERQNTRNRLRQDVVPELRREAGSEAPLVRTLDNLADDAGAIDAWAARLVAPPAPGESRTTRSIATASLAEVPRAVGAAALRRCARRLPGPVGWTRDQIDRALREARCLEPGDSPKRIAIRGGLAVVAADRTTVHATHDRGGEALTRRRAHPLAVPLDRAETPRSWNALPWFGTTFQWRHEPHDGADPPSEPTVAWFDATALPGELQLRGPREAERLGVFGMSGSKSIRDLMREGDVPERKRWRWPILARPDRNAPDSALWVAGLRRSSQAPVETSTEQRLVVRVLRRD